jgi:hypothetical protein
MPSSTQSTRKRKKKIEHTKAMARSCGEKNRERKNTTLIDLAHHP